MCLLVGDRATWSITGQPSWKWERCSSRSHSMSTAYYLLKPFIWKTKGLIMLWLWWVNFYLSSLVSPTQQLILSNFCHITTQYIKINNLTYFIHYTVRHKIIRNNLFTHSNKKVSYLYWKYIINIMYIFLSFQAMETDKMIRNVHSLDQNLAAKIERLDQLYNDYWCKCLPTLLNVKRKNLTPKSLTK